MSEPCQHNLWPTSIPDLFRLVVVGERVPDSQDGAYFLAREGTPFRFNVHRNKVSWSNDWVSVNAAAGIGSAPSISRTFLKTVNHGQSTYGHVDFILDLPEGSE
jgi:hypothetical protein